MAAFHAAHERAYGHRFDDPVEMVAVRLRAECPGPVGSLSGWGSNPASKHPVPVGSTAAYHGNGRIATPIYRRGDLGSETELTGPAIVVEAHATTVVGPEDRLTVASSGDLVIDVGAVES